MKSIRGRKNVQLLAGLLAFFVTASAVAQDSSVVKEKMTAWQRLLKSQTTIKQDSRTLQDLKSQGGPGMDGGGGSGVLLASGRLRFLDMASYEKRELKAFDSESYARIILKNGRYVSAAGELVKSSEFFSCSDRILSAQQNPLLQYLISKNLDIQIIKTSLPLEARDSAKIQTPYRSAGGSINSVVSLTPQSLKSPTYPEDFQRPIASYSAQSLGLGRTLYDQTLLISSQLYELLSERDRCALQVHEIFRYLGNFGRLSQDSGRSSLNLLTRPLTTLEIEKLTQKVMAGDPVSLSEIPATESYKLFSIMTRKELAALSSFELEALMNDLRSAGVLAQTVDENQISLGTTLILYEMWDNAKLSANLAEQGILEIAPRAAKAQQNRLKQKQIDLRDLLD